MSNQNVIEVDSIAKQYRLGLVGGGSMGDDLSRLWARMRRKPDPLLAVGEANDRTQVAHSNYVWALRDVSMSVTGGEVVGIIGRNGAGKSTLLKILSRITAPTSGEIRIRGRIGSLLEVGTGFHPELTGRENIFLNGAILGMSRAEVARKLDEIIDFSGCERYIDTPVKRYSSGMMVRLAFAVAAHLEPEILIVDEVLAVGDADFQKKCLGKMKYVAGTGRTVLFVSHNMGAVSALCPRCILLNNGTVEADGPTRPIIDEYLLGGASHEGDATWSEETAPGDKTATLRAMAIVDAAGRKSSTIAQDRAFHVDLTVDIHLPSDDLAFSVQLHDHIGNVVAHCGSDVKESMTRTWLPGRHTLRCSFLPHSFNATSFLVGCACATPMRKIHFKVERELNLSIESADPVITRYNASWPGYTGSAIYEWDPQRSDA